MTSLPYMDLAFSHARDGRTYRMPIQLPIGIANETF